MEKRTLDGFNGKDQALIAAVLANCNEKTCTTTHFCARCQHLIDIDGQDIADVPVTYFTENLKDAADVATYL